MCELFAFAGKEAVVLNPYLTEFFSHSREHKDGWGLAFFYENAVNVEKEPVSAFKSQYLKERLSEEIEAQTLFAHIRFATKGKMEYLNCHPFVKRDNYKRTWTLIHNGTIFESDFLDSYFPVQKGQTDSERILYYIVDCINRLQEQAGRALSKEERFRELDRIMCEITYPNNKVNIIICDGELMYAHMNCEGTLYEKLLPEGRMISTVPLDKSEWFPLKMNTLLAYENGSLVYSGTDHENTYIFREEDVRFLHLDSSSL